jgi:hypothetical protein
MGNHPNNPEFWGHLIHVYTRAQAIADGVLVDLTTATDDKGQLLCREAGFKIPIALTRGAWAKTIEAAGTWKYTDNGEVFELSGGQSLSGRVWDLLSNLRLACSGASGSDRFHFQVLVDGHGNGHREPVNLWALCGPGDDARPVMTVMLEGED